MQFISIVIAIRFSASGKKIKEEKQKDAFKTSKHISCLYVYN